MKKLKLICPICKKEFFRYPSQTTDRKNINCSYKCYWKSITGKRIGVTHDMGKTKFYQKWVNFKQRCTNPNNTSYSDYGGRGIKLSKEWNEFENFKNDMYDSYLKHRKKYGDRQTTLERIDNNGNYCKENCKWATQKEQCSNQRLRGYQKGYFAAIEDAINKIPDTLIAYTDSEIECGYPMETSFLKGYENCRQEVIKNLEELKK